MRSQLRASALEHGRLRGYAALDYFVFRRGLFDPVPAFLIGRACFDDLDAPPERVGGAEVPMPYSKPLELAALVLEDKLEAAARSLLAESGLKRTGGD